ncbi:MAG: UDP-N-acetylmuramate dehydrogenase [Christensenellaceae bacterium]|nr:UDP-N-acetylmuramate dehydrogenase [Christensenellaceae bacterium]
MTMTDIRSKLQDEHIICIPDAPMAEYTTFQAGGPADLLIAPASEQQLCFAIRLLRQSGTPFVVLGNGSNVLFTDKGFRGAVVYIGRVFSAITVEGGLVRAQAGARLSTAVTTALSHGLVGMEFAAGIPGSVGGGLFMNAGAYGGELCQVVKEARILDEQGDIRTIPVSAMELGYRSSIFMHKNWVILEVTFALEQGDVDASRAAIRELAARRRDKQPLEFPSAGSTFKRPKGYFAGALIENAGLKGFSVGGAQVSEKHSGFVINRGGATAGDIITLIHEVQRIVLEKDGVQLETEVRILGEA